jgi:predicted oxidoreductase
VSTQSGVPASSTETDVVVVGAGLAGLVATAELADAGKRVVLLEQEPEASFGGQAWWSFGGLFLIDSPEQRRLRVHDSIELARQDWFGSAGFDRTEDHWPRQWAEAYLQFAAGEKRSWLKEQGIGFFPIVGWAERGGYTATGHGNSVPRFHIVWGTGPAIVEPFARRVRAAVEAGRVELRFRHRVHGLVVTGGAVTGVRGGVLEDSTVARGEASSRTETGDFEITAQAVVLTAGGIGGNHELVRKNWPARLGPAPQRLLSGVPAHVDGHMLQATEAAGASVVNGDRMWHYTEGITNHSPVWGKHGIRILPGPSSMWFDATGKRLPVPLFPGFDTLGTLAHIGTTGYEHTWFIATQKIVEKEFGLSGSEQNPDLTGKDIRLLATRVKAGMAPPVQAFVDRGEDFVTATTLPELVAGMNRITGGTPELDLGQIEREIVCRDREIAHPFGKDMQIAAIRAARNYLGDKLIRVAPPHRILDPEAGPLIAVRLNIITRKTLGGLETDLSGRVLRPGGDVFPGLYAAGEIAGFGGGGMHGYRALEGTFLGGCMFSGRVAGRAAAAAL